MPASQPQSISTITFPQPVWRYLLLFQSWSQLQSWVVLVIAATFSMQAFLLYMNSREQLAVAFLGAAVLGALWPVLIAVPARFTVSPPAHASLDRLEAQLASLRYVFAGRVGASSFYHHDVPGIFHWNESNIELTMEKDRVAVTGPHWAIRHLRRTLLTAGPTFS